MSDAASVPFTETKAPESAERLHRGALSLIDISASTMANIGPAYSFFFGFGFLVFTAGVAAPPSILLGRSATRIPCHTHHQISRRQPAPVCSVFPMLTNPLAARAASPASIVCA